ncbi:MAG TPA: TatD family hydrolase [Prolixibacteraceae bacterium]|nr:TatD family hydrolase [Prolixibacteraceae bacterium]
MIPFIDVHTHKTNFNLNNTIIVRNILLPDEEIPQQGSVSAGWHPWHINNYSLFEIRNRLTKVANNGNVIALGECGIDRAIETPIQLQTEVFLLHIQIAMQVRKPLIVHNVKSYSDLLQILKSTLIDLPIVLHGYHGTPQQTEQFTKYNCYFSVGDYPVSRQNKMNSAINSIPLNRLLLETDESELSIEKIYIRTAEISNISVEELKKQIFSNFKTIFGDGLVKPY